MSWYVVHRIRTLYVLRFFSYGAERAMPEETTDAPLSSKKGEQTYVRLPVDLRTRYEAASKILDRSVSFLLRRAAERDLPAVEHEADEARAKKHSEQVRLKRKPPKT